MSDWQIGNLTLPGDLEWVDELGWTDRKQRERTSLAGTVITQRSTQVSGRPITIVTGQGFLVTRQQVLDLQQMAETADSFQVTHPDGRVFQCRFRWDGSLAPVDSATASYQSPPEPDDLCTLTLRLMTV